MTDETTETTAAAQAHNHGVYVSDSTWKAVKLLAQQMDRSTNWIVGRALLAFVEANKRKDNGGEA